MRRVAQLCALAARASAESGALEIRPGWPSATAFQTEQLKKITFIRHAEGLHNLHERELSNYYQDTLYMTDTYWDAKLTPTGEEQAYTIAVKQQWRRQQGLPEVVVVSPLSRTIQTATIGFPNMTIAAGTFPAPPMVATSLARERVWIHKCDKRRARDVLEKECAAIAAASGHLLPSHWWLLADSRTWIFRRWSQAMTRCGHTRKMSPLQTTRQRAACEHERSWSGSGQGLNATLPS